MALEWLFIALAALVGVRTLAFGQRLTAPLVALMTLGGAALAVMTTSAQKPAPPQPIALSYAGFATSNACRSCHPAEYASWHASYHRTMTQNATLGSVASEALRHGGRLHVETSGRTVELFAEREQLRARLPDPGVTSAAAPAAYEASFRAAPMREVPVELITGSHRHQAFWLSGARQGELCVLPAVYLIAEQRLIPRHDAFLNPPDAPEQAVRWNSNCIQCHAVAGAPGHDQARDVFRSSAAELGIACEACHGGGAAHVRAMQNPLARYRAHAGSKTELGIVNPAGLSSERASQVCGRCHAYFFPKHEDDWWLHGFARSYAPGGDLTQAQRLLSPEVLAAPDAPELGASADSLFYRDGTIRVGGREYNGLLRSACYERGHGDKKLSCLSCHSMHQGAPDKQLDPEKLGNAACTHCHVAQGANVSAHTHHPESSAGSLCYNCHMPRTSYALLGAIRSHRVDSPAFDASRQDRPNACNLCHLEQSEAWAAAQAAAWFGQKPSFVLERADALEAAHTPAGGVFALSGDAAVRAITAAALGRSEGPSAARALRAQLLSVLAKDDYAAVRSIAERSRRGLDLGPLPDALPPALFTRLLDARDRRHVTIAE